jgi:hypothetical protein
MAKKKPAKKKAAKKKAAPKKKAAKKKSAPKSAPKAAVGPRTADLNSIRAAIAAVRDHVSNAHPQAAARRAAAAPGTEQADRLLENLDKAYALMMANCCNTDQNCDF